MNGLLEKIFFAAYISIFIIELVVASNQQLEGPVTDKYKRKQAISDSNNPAQIFEFREGLVAWLSSHVINDIAEIEEKLKLNRSLERKTCPKKIVFSYVESNKSLILAQCQTQWRRFVKQPTSLSPRRIEETKPNQEVKDLADVLVLKRNIEKGEPIAPDDLVMKKLKVVDFLPFIPKLNDQAPWITSKDLKAGESLAQTDILVGRRVLTAASAIPSGSGLSETLTKIDIRYQGIPSDALDTKGGWAYMETNRTIMKGEIIRERYLRKAKLVRRKDPVILVNKSRSIQIITSGTAMQDGYYGQSVKVINTESGRSVVGTVIGRGKVAINAGQ